jgi:hypothetical protein
MTAITNSFYQGENLRTLARILANAVPLVPSNVDDWSVYLYDQDSSTPTTPIYSAVAQSTIATYLAPALFKPAYWPYNDDGMNFEHTILASLFTAVAGHKLRVEYVFNTNTVGQVTLVVDGVVCKSLLSA